MYYSLYYLSSIYYYIHYLFTTIFTTCLRCEGKSRTRFSRSLVCPQRDFRGACVLVYMLTYADVC
jgi:hypothetical protein